jgi:hypothetical protein
MRIVLVVNVVTPYPLQHVNELDSGWGKFRGRGSFVDGELNPLTND